MNPKVEYRQVNGVKITGAARDAAIEEYWFAETSKGRTPHRWLYSHGKVVEPGLLKPPKRPTSTTELRNGDTTAVEVTETQTRGITPDRGGDTEHGGRLIHEARAEEHPHQSAQS